MPHAKRLLILGQPRAGTTLLVSYLRSSEESVVVHAEPLAVTRRVVEPLEEVRMLLVNTEKTHKRAKVVGCRVTPEQLIHHGVTVTELVAELNFEFIVVVTRSHVLDMIVSKRLAERTGRYYSETPISIPDKITVTEEDIEEFITTSTDQWTTLATAWPTNIHPSIVTYADLASSPQPTLSNLWRSIGCTPVEAGTAMVRQHPGDSISRLDSPTTIPQSKITAQIDIVKILSNAGVPVGVGVGMDGVATPKTEDLELPSSPSKSRGVGLQSLPVLAVQVIIFHCFDAVLKEQIFHLPGFKYVEALSLIQSMCIASVALVDCRVSQQSISGMKMSAPFWVYALLGLLMSGSIIMTNKAILHLDFVTQVVFKSSKLLWVMVARLVFLRNKERPGWAQWVGAVMIVMGLGFMSSSTAKGQGDVVGLWCIVLALICDAGVFVVEEGLAFGRYNAGKHEVILFMQLLAIPPSAFYALASSPSPSFVTYAPSHPLVFFLAFGASTTSYFGTAAILQIVKTYNGATAALVTSFRKVSTILLSYVLFPKPLSVEHLVGTALILIGANANLMRKKKA